LPGSLCRGERPVPAMIAAILVAAGASRRMGHRNKLLLPWGSITLLEHALGVVMASRVGQVITVTGHEAETVLPFIEHKGVTLIENHRWSTGLTSSIQTGLRAVRPNATGFLIFFGDLPLVRTEDIDRIITTFEMARSQSARCIVVPAFKGRRGHPVLFSSAFREDMMNCEFADGCRSIMAANATDVREAPMPDDRTLRDVDTPESYWDLLALSGLDDRPAEGAPS